MAKAPASMSPMNATSEEGLQRLSRVPGYLFTAGAVGLILSLVGYFVAADRFYFSWLTAFSYWTTLSLGALFFVMLHHVTGAKWSVALRRGAEALGMNLPWLLLFFVPVLLGMHTLYHWSHADAVAHDAVLQSKSAYLNPGFFTIRGVAYFLIWIALAWLLYRISIIQDQEGGWTHIEKLRKVSAPGLVLFAFSVTFAAFDWLMSLDPHWYSTIFGVFLFVSGFLVAIAFLTVFYILAQKWGLVRQFVNGEHFHDLGRLMFAFTVFWAYIGGSQYFLIWYANVPEETSWFLHRWDGGWRVVSLCIVFLHFLVPFAALIFHAAKQNRRMLTLVGSVLLVMHYVNMYWLVMPTLAHGTAALSWIDIAAFIGMGGILLGLFLRRFLRHPVVPVGDPLLLTAETHHK
ncbi:hypothetical protein ACFL6Q_01680 [Candidatus Neomarinimicrobiota bacterium]